MTSLICNLVDLIVSGVERMATEIVTQHLGCDNIRILVKDLIDTGCCHLLGLAARKQIRTVCANSSNILHFADSSAIIFMLVSDIAYRQ